MQIKGLEEEDYQKHRAIHHFHTNVRTSIATHFLMVTENTVQVGTHAHTHTHSTLDGG